MTSLASTQANDEISQFAENLNRIREEMAKEIVGQRYMVDRLILALIADGHILLEGLPGLAKTTAVKALASAIKTSFMRISFTPDLLPADLLGTEIFRPDTGKFTIKKGPIFTNLLLADEINRAPAKVQSALLEAMQERQVTIGDETHLLDKPFLVLATQNPVEQEGTYPLPEAQVDRFMLKLQIGYPTREEEKEIMRRFNGQAPANPINTVLTPEDIMKARTLAQQVYVDPKVEEYVVNLIFATREPGAVQLSKLERLIEIGASPRATIYLLQGARVHGMMQGRSYVTPQDVKEIAPDILRHRILLTYEAEAQELTSDDIIQDILNTVDVP
ncbi:MAG: MoxR family ATPase [Myxococcota bacterium]|nr:MoxR family ATPase [Myxococcota bacterium]